MDAARPLAGIGDDARPRTTFWIAITVLVTATPFAIGNLLSSRPALAVSSLIVVTVLLLNAWGAHTRRCGPTVALVTVVPVAIAFLAMSTSTQGVIGLLWCFPTIAGFYCVLPQRMAWAANAALLAVQLPVLAGAIEPEVALRGGATLGALSLFVAIQLRIIDRQRETLAGQVVTDPLTGLLNRHALVPTLDGAIGRVAAGGAPAALMLVDLDHFKRINDEHGHEVGDEVLRGLGALLRDRLRPGDAAFRIGGDEFLVLLHGTDAAEAGALAEATRQAVKGAELLAGRTLTASVGHAPLCDGHGQREWVRRADSALYRAKADGRDRSVGEPCDDA